MNSSDPLHHIVRLFINLKRYLLIITNQDATPIPHSLGDSTFTKAFDIS
jgi:hypothetical protein